MKFRLIGILFIAIFGCTPSKPSESGVQENQNIILPSYAKGFQFATINNHRCLQLFDLVKETPVLSHTLFLSDSAATPEVEGKVIFLGSKPNFATLSTTHLAYFLKINALEKVKGTAYAKYVQNEVIKNEIEKGAIQDISGEKDIDFEKLVSLNPRALLTYPYGDADYRSVEAAGIDIVPFSEYLEKHPLGRAEWIKVMGFLSGKEDEANALFKKIEQEYNVLLALKNSHENLDLPEVFTGSHSNGKWYAPARSSFIAQFIKDAGAHYLFDEPEWDESLREGENIEMDFEVFISKAAEADFWGKVVYEDHALTYDNIQDEDQRYTALKAFKNGGIFYCNASKTDYFGDALLEPQYILSDLMHMLHPEFFTADADYIPHYFQPLRRE